MSIERVDMAKVEAQRAALKRGEWVTGKPGQVRAQVPVKAPGGVPVYTVRTVWRGRVWRQVEGKTEQEFCPHNHLKPGPAQVCGQRAARRLNRAARQERGGERCTR